MDCISKEKNNSFAEDKPDRAEPSKGLTWNVMLVTMANGADNIGVYIPLFAGYSIAQMAVAAAIFSLMIALWCFLGKKLADLPALRTFLLKYKYRIVPIVFIALGVYIILRSGLIE